MRFTCNFNDGKLARIHPDPGNQCNTELSKMDDVRHLTLGELVCAIIDDAETLELVTPEMIDARICEHCGAAE